MNKKGTILGDIGQTISSVLDLIPRPIKLLFFLALILLIGSLIQYSIQIFGIFCDSSGTPVKIDFNIFVAVNMMGKSADLLSGGTRSLDFGEKLAQCSIKTDAGTLKDYSNLGLTETIVGNVPYERYYYLTSPCVHCDGGDYVLENATYQGQPIMPPNPTQTPSINNRYFVCIGNAYAKNSSDLNWIEKIQCSKTAAEICKPPTHRYYNFNYNYYTCLENEPNCDESLLKEWDSLLYDNNAESLYSPSNQTENVRDYEHAVGISCQKYKPTISVFGFPIFDYKIWLLLFIIIIIYWMLKNIK
jgi:hypothetical protein